jgi:hypothetical protein
MPRRRASLLRDQKRSKQKLGNEIVAQLWQLVYRQCAITINIAANDSNHYRFYPCYILVPGAEVESAWLAPRDFKQ